MKTSSFRSYLFGILSVLCLLHLINGFVLAQTEAMGNKGVYNSSGSVAASADWIDASAFCGSSGCSNSTDFCSVLHQALGQVPPTGAVVDARGLVPLSSPTGTYSCSTTMEPNPFNGISYPSTVLLPAYTIVVTSTWILPNNTKLIGQGPSTDLQAVNGLGGPIIVMGTSCPSSGCTSIGVEHLLLDGSAAGTTFTYGIDNQLGEDGSYVSDVNFYQFSAAGLYVESGATNSGPYENISYGGGSLYKPCVTIATQTLGLKGITCVGSTSMSPGEAGIIIYASNNSVEYAHLESFYDGIEIGNTSASSTVGNVFVSSVTGSNTLMNVVHICYSSHTSCSNTYSAGPVEDVTILQAGLIENQTDTTTILDDVTQTSIQECYNGLVPVTTASYILGEPMGSAGYSRFASNPSYPGGTTCSYYGSGSTIVPTWGFGDTSLPSLPACVTPGALYSNTTGGSMTSVYVCSFSGWKPIA